MNIIGIKVLKGPNYWSGYRKNLIEMKLDLGRFEELPTDKLPGFNQKLIALLPGLKTDHCSEGHEGGFVERLERGTWLGHVIEHVALELQCMAEMDCGYGRTRSTGTAGIYHVVFAYMYEDAGKLAATAAVRLVDALASGEDYDATKDLADLKEIANEQKIPDFAELLINLATARKIPTRYDRKNATLLLGQGINQAKININNLTATDFQDEKEATTKAKDLLNSTFPKFNNARIPVVAVTGTNGKTTTTRLIAHIAGQTGLSVGFTTTDGIYLNDKLLKAGDCSGPRSASVLLDHNEVEFAVLECARGGILRSGLAFDHCNVSIVTNVTEDHIGLADINSVEQLARVKSVVPASTFDEGYAVLNAADPLVLRMRRDLDCHIVLFAIDGTRSEMVKHIHSGGTAAFVTDDMFCIAHCGQIKPVINVAAVPLTFNGTASVMVQNVLAAIAASVVSGFSIEHIASALRTFYPSVAQTPGRLNTFQLKKGRLILDYVHNTGGFAELIPFIKQQEARKRTGIIYATGDRRPEDIRLIGVYAAKMFDNIIINNEHEQRGVSPIELTNLLLEGIREVNETLPVMILPDEKSAITYAIEQAEEDELVFASINAIKESIELVNNLIKDQQTKDEIISPCQEF